MTLLHTNDGKIDVMAMQDLDESSLAALSSKERISLAKATFAAWQDGTGSYAPLIQDAYIYERLHAILPRDDAHTDFEMLTGKTGFAAQQEYELLVHEAALKHGSTIIAEMKNSFATAPLDTIFSKRDLTEKLTVAADYDVMAGKYSKTVHAQLELGFKIHAYSHFSRARDEFETLQEHPENARDVSESLNNIIRDQGLPGEDKNTNPFSLLDPLRQRAVIQMQHEVGDILRAQEKADLGSPAVPKAVTEMRHDIDSSGAYAEHDETFNIFRQQVAHMASDGKYDPGETSQILARAKAIKHER